MMKMTVGNRKDSKPRYGRRIGIAARIVLAAIAILGVLIHLFGLDKLFSVELVRSQLRESYTSRGRWPSTAEFEQELNYSKVKVDAVTRLTDGKCQVRFRGLTIWGWPPTGNCLTIRESLIVERPK